MLAAAGLIILYWLRYVFLMAFLGLLIAILFDTMASFGCRFLRMPRGPAVVLSAALFIALMAGALLLLSVPLTRESTSLIQSLEEKSSSASQKIEHWKKDFPWLGQFLPNWDSPSREKNRASAPEVAQKALVTVSNLVETGADALAILFLAIFLAWNPDRWLRGVVELGPRVGIEERKALFCRIGGALRSYLFTYGIYIVAMGTLWSLGLWIIGVDYYLVFGILGGLMEVAPYVGPLIAFIPPLLMTLFTAPNKAIYLLLLYALLHIVEGYLLVPYLMHQREHLPPPIVVLSLLAFGTLFGMMGVLLAVPLGTTAYVIANETIYSRRK